MTIFTILIDAVTLIVCGLAVSGCGKEELAAVPAPDPTVASADSNPSIAAAAPVVVPTAAPTATPTPNPTLVRYTQQDVSICTALHNWDPNSTTIKTYNGQTNSETFYYLFRWDGVWQISPGGCEAGCLANTTLTRSDIHGLVCTITITSGQLTAVTP